MTPRSQGSESAVDGLGHRSDIIHRRVKELPLLARKEYGCENEYHCSRDCTYDACVANSGVYLTSMLDLRFVLVD